MYCIIEIAPPINVNSIGNTVWLKCYGILDY